MGGQIKLSVKYGHKLRLFIHNFATRKRSSYLFSLI